MSPYHGQLYLLVTLAYGVASQSAFNVWEDATCLCGGVQWVRGAGSLLPPGVIYVGEDVPGGVGGPVYVARAKVNNKVRPGKLVRDYGKAVVYDNAGNRYEMDDFELLTSFVSLQFVNNTATDLPEKAIAAGYEEDYSELFICRAEYAGRYVPGKLVAKTNRCYFEADSQEHLALSFQVLTVRN